MNEYQVLYRFEGNLYSDMFYAEDELDLDEKLAELGVDDYVIKSVEYDDE